MSCAADRWAQAVRYSNITGPRKTTDCLPLEAMMKLRLSRNSKIIRPALSMRFTPTDTSILSNVVSGVQSLWYDKAMGLCAWSLIDVIILDRRKAVAMADHLCACWASVYVSQGRCAQAQQLGMGHKGCVLPRRLHGVASPKPKWLQKPRLFFETTLRLRLRCF